jgi:hypothetical protein
MRRPLAVLSITSTAKLGSAASTVRQLGAGKEDMVVQARRLAVVREAIDVVLRHLECLPWSDRTEHLHVWVHECLKQTEQWNASAPTDREREGLMKRVLALHVAVTKLERDTLPAKREVATR